MLPLTIIIIGLICALTPKEFIEKHIVMELDPDDENF